MQANILFLATCGEQKTVCMCVHKAHAAAIVAWEKMSK